MRDLTSDSGKYYAVQQDDGNFVVYDKRTMTPIWDEWSFDMIPQEKPIEYPPIPEAPTTIISPSIWNQSEPIEIPTASWIRPFGMSYWRNINKHTNSPYLQVFISQEDKLIVRLLDKKNLRGISEYSLDINHTGEGCFFSALNEDRLYVPVDNEMRAYDVSTGRYLVPFRLNADEKIWQPHLNYNETRMSCTVKDSDWNFKEWYCAGNRYPFKGKPDECQIDKSGDWLLIKEDDDNRIIYIATGAERIIGDFQGAVGHSDNGFNFTLGEFDKANLGGAVNLLEFDTGGQTIVYFTGIWNLGYVSYSNAKPGADTFYLLSTPKQLIKVNFNGGAQVIADIPYNSPNDYNNRVKANLCPDGEYAAFTAFRDGKLRAYIVRIP